MLDGMRADISPFRSESDAIAAPPTNPILTTAQLVNDAFERGQRAERSRCADVASLYPVFAYDGDTGELLRLRDNISQAIEKLILPGQPIP